MLFIVSSVLSLYVSFPTQRKLGVSECSFRTIVTTWCGYVHLQPLSIYNGALGPTRLYIGL